MPRPILDGKNFHLAIRNLGLVETNQQPIVQEVMAAIKDNDVVVVGMGFNPFPKQACKALDSIQQFYKFHAIPVGAAGFGT